MTTGDCWSKFPASYYFVTPQLCDQFAVCRLVLRIVFSFNFQLLNNLYEMRIKDLLKRVHIVILCSICMCVSLSEVNANSVRRSYMSVFT